jgi:hypothetical protein
MTTPTWITGFEYGLPTPLVTGTGLIDAIVGSCTIPSIANGLPHSGSYSLKCSATGSVLAYISRNMTAGKTFVGRFYFYLLTLPTADKILYSITTVGHKIQLSFKQADSKLYIGIDGALTTVGPVVTALMWYCVDIKAVTSANPWLIDWQVDSAAQTQLSNAHAAEDMSVLDYGLRTLGTQTVYYDDIVHSVTAADYPIGAGGTYGLRPNADGVHNNGANILEDSAGHDIDGVNYFAWSLLDENPWGTALTDRIQQTNVGSANYLEFLFEDLLDAGWNIIGVDSLLEYAAAGTAADTGGCVIRDGVTQTTLWGNQLAKADYSESSAYFKHAIVTCSAGAWTKALVDGLKGRLGYSDDVADIPYWLAVMLEVGYRHPISSELITNASIGIEENQTTPTERITNASIGIEQVETTPQMRITNAAIMLEIILDTKVTDFGPRIEMIP